MHSHTSTQRTRSRRKAVNDEMEQSLVMKAIDYPEGWSKIRCEIMDRATTTRRRVQCECRGECGKHSERCDEINHTWPRSRRRRGKAKVILTTAHLCHAKKCEKRTHLRAMCQPCHLIYDQRCRQQGLRGSVAMKWAMRVSKHRDK